MTSLQIPPGLLPSTQPPTPPTRRIGRPPEPVPEDVAAAIIDGLYAGRTLTSILKDPGMPTDSTVSRWCAKDPEFAGEFARAREYAADMLVDQAQDVADDATEDGVQVAKLRCEMLWKRAACFRPAKYGQNARVEHQGGISLQVVTGVPSPQALAAPGAGEAARGAGTP